MGGKLKVAGFVALGAIAGALTTIQLTAFARNTLAPLPLDELQQLAAVFGMVKSDYVEAVDEKKLITDAISGMVAGLDPHSVYFDKKTFKEFREATTGRFVGIGIEMGMEDGLVKVVSPIEGSPARPKSPVFPASAKARNEVCAPIHGDWPPRQESNLYLALRRHLFYPLNYGEPRQYNERVT